MSYIQIHRLLQPTTLLFHTTLLILLSQFISISPVPIVGADGTMIILSNLEICVKNPISFSLVNGCGGDNGNINVK